MILDFIQNLKSSVKIHLKPPMSTKLKTPLVASYIERKMDGLKWVNLSLMSQVLNWDQVTKLFEKCLQLKPTGEFELQTFYIQYSYLAH